MPFLDTIPRQTKRLFLWQPFCRKDTGVIFIKLRWLMAKRILLADDSPFWREQLRTILEDGSDWTVFQATNGAEALLKSGLVQPDAVILDACMPILDGLAAARELKRVTPELPVFLVTVDKSRSLELAAGRVGVPVFSKMEFLALRNLLSRAQVATAA